MEWQTRHIFRYVFYLFDPFSDKKSGNLRTQLYEQKKEHPVTQGIYIYTYVYLYVGSCFRGSCAVFNKDFWTMANYGLS